MGVLELRKTLIRERLKEWYSQGLKCFKCNVNGHIHKKCPNYIKSKGKAMNATLSNSKSSSSEDNSDSEGNFIAPTAIAEVGDGNS